MKLSIHIEADTPQALLEKVRELYVKLLPPTVEIVPKKYPAGVSGLSSNVLSTADRLSDYLDQNVETGANFSSTSAMLHLGFTTSKMQCALQGLRKKGTIEMVRKGIYRRIL